MAEASSLDDDLKKGLCRRLSTLKANVAPVLDDLITDLVEKEALSWEERHEIMTFPGKYRQTDRLIEVIIDNNRMRPFVEVFHKFNPKFVAEIYKEEQITVPTTDSNISQRLARLELADRKRRVREDKFFNKVEDIMQNGVNQMVDAFKHNISQISESSGQKLDETMFKIEKHITDFRGSFQELMQELQKAQLNEKSDTNLEKKISNKFNTIEKQYDEIEKENQRLLSLQKDLRQRIIDLEERQTKLFQENIILKTECRESKAKIEKSDASLLAMEKEIKELKEHLLTKDKYISFIEKEFELIKKENGQLRQNMTSFVRSKQANVRETLKSEFRIQGNVCGKKLN